jgi:hypothetical protein
MESPMEPPETCQACLRSVDASRLEYRRGDRVIRNGALLQCDVCERLACADCMGVYDILSGYDFLCHPCAREVDPSRLRAAIAQNQPARPYETKEVAAPLRPKRQSKTGRLDT